MLHQQFGEVTMRGEIIITPCCYNDQPALLDNFCGGTHSLIEVLVK